MNVANLSLCKELYELSGWETNYGIGWQLESQLVGFPYQLPAYDLGYLLRKLPDRDKDALFGKPTITRHGFAGDWFAYWQNDDLTIELGTQADTPEDAACKLAIELFKQGVLL